MGLSCCQETKSHEKQNIKINHQENEMNNESFILNEKDIFQDAKFEEINKCNNQIGENKKEKNKHEKDSKKLSSKRKNKNNVRKEIKENESKINIKDFDINDKHENKMLKKFNNDKVNSKHIHDIHVIFQKYGENDIIIYSSLDEKVCELIKKYKNKIGINEKSLDKLIFITNYLSYKTKYIYRNV